MANCVIFHTVVDMTAENLAVISPYLTGHIQRFGVYSTDEVTLAPGAYDARLGVVLELSGGLTGTVSG